MYFGDPRSPDHVQTLSKVLGGAPGQVIDLTADETTVRIQALLALWLHELYATSAARGPSTT